MSVRTTKRAPRKTEGWGKTVWINQSPREVKLRLHGDNGPLPVINVQPGDTIELSSEYDGAMPAICGRWENKPCLIELDEAVHGGAEPEPAKPEVTEPEAAPAVEDGVAEVEPEPAKAQQLTSAQRKAQRRNNRR